MCSHQGNFRSFRSDAQILDKEERVRVEAEILVVVVLRVLELQEEVRRFKQILFLSSLSDLMTAAFVGYLRLRVRQICLRVTCQAGQLAA